MSGQAVAEAQAEPAGDWTPLDREIATYDRLDAELTEAREKLDALEGERSELVLDARVGDAAARKRLAEVDGELPAARQEVADLTTAVEAQAGKVAEANRAEEAEQRRQKLADVQAMAERRAGHVKAAERALRKAADELAQADEIAREMRRATPEVLREQESSPLTPGRIRNRLGDFLAAWFPGLGLQRASGGIIEGDLPEPALLAGERQAHGTFLSALQAEVEDAEGEE